MEDLTKHFIGCKLNTEQIRESIKNILKVDPYIPFFCYRCFKNVNVTSQKVACCDKCFQPYCYDCMHHLAGPGSGPSGIDPAKCIQCLENSSGLE
jgi:hypothetical protein